MTESDSTTVIKVADYLLENEILIHQIHIPTAAIIGRLAISISRENEGKKTYYRCFIEPFADPNTPVEIELSIE